jgi:nitrate reductase NapE component
MARATRARRSKLTVVVVVAAVFGVLVVTAAVARAGTAVYLYQVLHAPVGRRSCSCR